VYKEAVQSLADKTYNIERTKVWNKELATVYNRGFWSGYYLGKNIGEWTKQYGSKATMRKTYIGKITNYFSHLKVAEVKIEAGVLHKGDKYIVTGNTTGVYEDILSEIRLDLNPVNKVKQGDICSIPTRELLRRGDKLYSVKDVKI
jgi:putative protease